MAFSGTCASWWLHGQARTSHDQNCCARPERGQAETSRWGAQGNDDHDDLDAFQEHSLGSSR